jgi:hypothetical protein
MQKVEGSNPFSRLPTFSPQLLGFLRKEAAREAAFSWPNSGPNIVAGRNLRAPLEACAACLSAPIHRSGI